NETRMRRALGYADLVALGVGGIIGSGWLFSVLSAASVAGPASFYAWVIGGIISVLLALAWAELAGMFPRSGATSRVPFYTHGSFLGFELSWIRYLAVATIPAIEAEAVVTAMAAILDRLRTGPALTTATAFGAEHFARLTTVGILLAVGLVIAFLLLNLSGVRTLGEANRWVTIWKVAIPLLTAGTLLAVFRPGNFTAPPGGMVPYGAASVVAAVGSSGIMFAYLGFAQMLDFGAEARRPGRDMPKALLTAVALATGVYCGLSLAFLGAVRWTGAGLAVGNWSGLGGSPWANLPLYYAVVANPGFVFAGIGVLLLVDAGISPSGTGWIYLGTSTRSLFGWAEESRLPGQLVRVNPRGVPAVALLVSAAVGILFLLPLPSWYELVGFLSSATVLTYVVGSLAVPALRRTAAGWSRPFRPPGMAIVAPAGFVAAALVLFWAGFELLAWMVAIAVAGEIVYLAWAGPLRHGIPRTEAYGTALLLALVLGAWSWAGPIGSLGGGAGPGAASPIWSRIDVAPDLAGIAIGVALLLAPWAYLRVRGDPARSAPIRAAGWFPAWWAALFPLGYFGEFGPVLGNGSPGTPYPGAQSLPFPIGTLLAAGLAVVVFTWAVRAAYRTPELLGRADA
ncbi:MAG TPA: APC family permease, partial [Thermoplasmata archaeon]|nr:APC family permease [Thermoplasmata archaeon]